ncbi:DUF6427 family protein [Maribacter sp. 2307UL18-2]|uniref:DUF6427 family protein n=1 Tax=Maribacter sp. 2307UL18-2 TaxID=3386274 RepID=UPI0039BCF4DB
MISSIFGKTKPINYIIVLVFLFVFYWFWHAMMSTMPSESEVFALKLLASAVLLLSVFVADFIVKRNKLTEPNSFAILFYAILVLVFPETLLDNDAVFCSLFLLLASRRLISIRSLKNIKLKIFDATVWVMVSSVFYDWAILYLLLVFAAIYIYEPKNIRNWMVPFAGIFTVFMIGYGILVLAGNTAYITEHYQLRFNWDSSYFSNIANSSKLILYILLIFALSIYAFLKLGKAGLGKIVTMRLIAFSFVIGLVVKILTKSSDDYPIMITFFPAVIFLTNYVESIKKANIKELVLMASIAVPLLVRAIGLIIG